MRTRTVLISALIVLAAALAAGQKIETVDGVKVVHNSGPGAWGKTPKVALEPVLTLGDVDTADENLAFYMPSAIAVDGAGNLFVLDTGQPPRPEVRARREIPGHLRPPGPGAGRVLLSGLAGGRRQGLHLRLRSQQPAHPGPDAGRQGPQDDQGDRAGRRSRIPGEVRGARHGRAAHALRHEPRREEARGPAQAGQGPRRRRQARPRVRRARRLQERSRQHRRERGHHDRRRRRPGLSRLHRPRTGSRNTRPTAASSGAPTASSPTPWRSRTRARSSGTAAT